MDFNFYRVYKGYVSGTLLRAHTKGPCNYPKSLGLGVWG